MVIQDIPVSKVKKLGKRLWQINKEKVISIAESIKVIGLLNPIIVLEDESGYILLSGEHRLLAYKHNKIKTIPAIVHQKQYDDMELEKAKYLIIEADENLARRRPDSHEEAYMLWYRKEAYQTLFLTPEIKKIRSLKKEIHDKVCSGLSFDKLQKELEELELNQKLTEMQRENELKELAMHFNCEVDAPADADAGEILHLKQKLAAKDKEIADLKSQLANIKVIKVGRKAYSNTEVIELIKELRNNGDGYLKIANELNTRGVLTDRNKPWRASSIKCIVQRHIDNK